METMTVASTALDLSPQSVRQARNVFQSAADRLGLSPEARHAGSLAVSEMVTNAISHGSEPIELRTVLEPTSIRVEVSDCGPEMPISSVEKPEAIGGRGLGIIEAIAQAWGYDRHGDDGGKTVWFTLPRTVRI